MSDWVVHKKGLRFVAMRATYSNWAGSYYEFARLDSIVQRFWFRKNVQAYVDKLNQQELDDENSVECIVCGDRHHIDDSRCTDSGWYGIECMENM